MVHEVQMGTRKRMSFSRINEVLDMPDLIEVQKNSYQRFVDEDLREVLDDISPITDYTEKLVLEFVDYKIDFDHPKYSVEECKERDAKYAAPLRVSVRLINHETGEIKEQEIFMEAMDLAQTAPSLSQAQRMKKLSQEGGFTLDAVREIMTAVKKGDLERVTFRNETLRKYFPKSYSTQQMQDTIIKLLEQWQKRKQRDQGR